MSPALERSGRSCDMAFSGSLDFGPHTGWVGSQVAQRAGRESGRVADQAEENVLGADVLVASSRRTLG
jgi:hypothetical protein